MKLNIKEAPVGGKYIAPLHYSKIAIRSPAYESLVWPSHLLHQMMATCLTDDGIGLAAPQIGMFKRIFIIRDFEDLGKLKDTFSVYINPTWTAVKEDGKSTSVEGCLSVPGRCYEVERWNTIEATWLDWDDVSGAPKMVKETITGYRARVFQHEFQHLNGTSIVDVGTPA